MLDYKSILQGGMNVHDNYDSARLRVLHRNVLPSAHALDSLLDGLCMCTPICVYSGLVIRFDLCEGC